MSRARGAIAQLWPRLAAVGILLLVWWAVYATKVFDTTVFPSPLAVIRALGHNLSGDAVTGSMALAIQRSLIRLAPRFPYNPGNVRHDVVQPLPLVLDLRGHQAPLLVRSLSVGDITRDGRCARASSSPR